MANPGLSPTLGLSMIVKNGGEDLRLCLQSVRSLVSQIVIADTGSTDNTLDLAAEFDAEIISYPWTDHYADARNAALAPMRTDWVLVLDADEELSPDACESLLKLIAETPEDIGGYEVPIRNYCREAYIVALGRLSRRNTDPYERAKLALSYVEHHMVRLIRRRRDIYFTNRLHEQADPQICAAGMRVGVADFRILHYGMLRPNTTKRAYYRSLGRKKLEENPNEPLTWFEIATEEIQTKHFARALRYMQKAYRLSNSPTIAYWLAYLYQQEKKIPQALKLLQSIPEDHEMAISGYALMGEILEEKGNLNEAHAAYSAALAISGQLSGGETSIQAQIESKLGFVEVMLHRPQEGIPRMQQAIEKIPSAPDLYDRLVKAWVICQREDLAAQVQERMLRYYADEKNIARAAALRLRSGNRERARQVLEKGLKMLPNSRRIQALLAELH